MSFYPSDEYDSSELERDLASRTKRQMRRWLVQRRRDDDDDDPPAAPAAPWPTPLPVVDGMAEAA